VGRMRFSLQSHQPLDRVRLLRDQGVGTLICGGVQSSLEDLMHAGGIRVLSWVSGTVEELLERFLQGRLVPGTGRLVDGAHRGPRPGRGSDARLNRLKKNTSKGISRLP
jgi:predicted Fe-Mo cluster-binding NifX family protein